MSTKPAGAEGQEKKELKVSRYATYAPEGIFYYIRSKCRKNPHEAGEVEVTASSMYSSTSKPEAVLDWGTKTFWQSQEQPDQWLMIDLKNRSIAVSQIGILRTGSFFAKKWELLGSNDGNEWESVFRSDTNVCLRGSFLNDMVLVQVGSSKAYSKFKFVSLAANYKQTKSFGFSAVEFFGTANEDIN